MKQKKLNRRYIFLKNLSRRRAGILKFGFYAGDLVKYLGRPGAGWVLAVGVPGKWRAGLRRYVTGQSNWLK